jgi:hypothetical protein
LPEGKHCPLSWHEIVTTSRWLAIDPSAAGHKLVVEELASRPRFVLASIAGRARAQW